MVKSFLNPVFSLQGTLFHVPKAHMSLSSPRLANAVSLAKVLSPERGQHRSTVLAVQSITDDPGFDHGDFINNLWFSWSKDLGKWNHISLTWIVGPFGDDSPYRPWFQWGRTVRSVIKFTQKDGGVSASKQFWLRQWAQVKTFQSCGFCCSDSVGHPHVSRHGSSVTWVVHGLKPPLLMVQSPLTRGGLSENMVPRVIIHCDFRIFQYKPTLWGIPHM